MHIAFNLLRDVEAQLCSAVISRLFGIYNYTQFAACLDGVTFFNTIEAKAKLFELFQALDVLLHHLATGTRACATDGITRLNDRSDDTCHFYFVVVSADSVAYCRVLLVFLGEFHADDSMWLLEFFGPHFADVVKKAGDTTVTNLADLKQAREQAAQSGREWWVLLVQRGGETLFVEINLKPAKSKT